MAWFGGSDEDSGRQSGGGVLDFLWKAVKFIGIALAAAVTMGAVFDWSPRAKIFIDELTGSTREGDNRGAATWALGMYEKLIKNPINNLLNPNATKDDFSGTIKVGDHSLHKVPTQLGTNPVATNRDNYLETENSTKKEKEWETLEESERFKKREEFKAKRGDTLKYGIAIVESNIAAEEFIAKNKDSGLPLPPVIPLTIPELPKELDEYRKSKGVSDESWKELARNPLKMVQRLEEMIAKDTSQYPELRSDTEGKWILERMNAERAVRNSLPGSITSLKQIISSSIGDHHGGSGLTNFMDVYVNPWGNNGETHEIVTQAIIAELIDAKRFSEAKIVIADATKEFKRAQGELKKSYPNEAKRSKDDDYKEKNNQYNNAIGRYQKAEKFVAAEQARYEYKKEGGYGDKVYSAILTAASIAPNMVKDYAQKVAEFGSNGSAAPSPDTTTPPTPTQKLMQAANPTTTPAAANASAAATAAIAANNGSDGRSDEKKRQELNRTMSHNNPSNNNNYIGFQDVSCASCYKPTNTPQLAATKENKTQAATLPNL